MDGSAEQNQCLVAYLVDGKYRALTVADATGATVARCMTRLMLPKQRPIDRILGTSFSEEGVKPFLLVEDLYYAMPQHAIHQALKYVLHRFATHVASLWDIFAVVRPNEMYYAADGSDNRPPEMLFSVLESLGRWVPVSSVHTVDSLFFVGYILYLLVFFCTLYLVLNLCSFHVGTSAAPIEYADVIRNKICGPFAVPSGTVCLLPSS